MRGILSASTVIGEAFLSAFRARVSHLILHVTNRCNMRCKHCFVDFSGKAPEMSLDEIRAVSKALPRLIWLDIGGGEPLVRGDLEEIVSLFSFEELSIPSNGWETGMVAERFKKIHEMTSGKLVVTLSLDGLQKTHDDIRAASSFERTVRTFGELKKIKGLRVKFNTVLCEKNYDEIPELMEFVRGLGPDFHSILMLRGSPLDPSMRLPPVDKIEALGERIWDIQRSYGYGRKGILSRMQRNYQRYKRNVVCETLKKRSQVVRCLAGRSHLVMWPDGGVSPCELLPAIGNIREGGLKTVLKGQGLKKAVSSIRARKCHCTHDCNMIENILFDPKSYSKLLLADNDAERQ